MLHFKETSLILYSLAAAPVPGIPDTVPAVTHFECTHVITYHSPAWTDIYSMIIYNQPGVNIPISCNRNAIIVTTTLIILGLPSSSIFLNQVIISNKSSSINAQYIKYELFVWSVVSSVLFVTDLNSTIYIILNGGYFTTYILSIKQVYSVLRFIVTTNLSFRFLGTVRNVEQKRRIKVYRHTCKKNVKTTTTHNETRNLCVCFYALQDKDVISNICLQVCIYEH